MVIAAIGSIAVFVSVASLGLWFAGLRQPSSEARLNRLAGTARSSPLDAPFSDRIVLPIVGGITGVLINLLPHSFVARIGRQLTAAGNPMTTQGFFTMVTVGSVLLPVTILVLALSSSGGAIPAAGLLALGVFSVLGFVGPFLWLSRRVKARKLKVWKSLPDAFDMVTVSVEAGLGLDAAMRHVSERMRGPLTDEIRQMLREVGMGRARREALEEMAERVDVKEVGTFVNAVIQAEQLGTSLGRVLRSQSAMLRIQRRQRVEEMSRKAPVKLVFPLVLCIMPSFFVVTLGPIGIRLVDVLSK